MTLMPLRRCFRLLKKVGTTPANPRRAETRCFPMKAACEKQPKAYPLVYVEDCFEPRTKLAGVFSIRYSETGMNCRIHAPKLPGFRL